MSTGFRRWWLMVALVGCAVVLAPAFASAGPDQIGDESHSWGGYHWARTANPFNLKLMDNVSGPWDSILGTTSSDWSASSVLNTSIVAGSGSAQSCSPVSGRVKVCSASYGSTGWLGVAQIWITGSTHITQGTVKLNDTYHNSPPYNTTAWRNLVSCQEVGHTLGLDHQDTNFNNPNLNTCMDYTNNPSSNQHPNTHDYNQLVTIYSHLDSINTVGPSVFNPGMPPAMRQIELESIRQWGSLVRLSPDGHTSVHMLDFGHGNKVFTFVIWASL